MLESTCTWGDCDRPAFARGLCSRCHMRARRAGTLANFSSPDVQCAQCGGLFPEGTKSGKSYCSSTCQQLAYKRAQAARRVDLLGERNCALCLEPVPLERRKDARHCSVQCQQADWYLSNAERLREAARTWASGNRDRRNEYQHRREARKLALDAERIDIERVWERDGWVCWICRAPVDPTKRFPDPSSRSIDHVIPLARGGAHTFANVATAHLRCNISKKDRLLSHLPSWFNSEGEEEPLAVAAESA